MIIIENLHKSFKENEVLKGLNLKVVEGEIYGFIGKNGAGKTTTLNILAGISAFNDGKCSINSKTLSKEPNGEFGNCGFLPEEPKFYSYMTGFEYLSLMGKILGQSKQDITIRSNELLKIVGLIETKKKKIGSFSRGMRQRLGLAVAMYHKPKVLLLDEPSSALDPVGRQDMANILLSLKNEGVTIMLSTHILSDVESICDRVGVLSDGKMALEGKLDDILKEYANPGYDIYLQEQASNNDIEILKALPFVKSIGIEGKKLMLLTTEPEKNINTLYSALSKFRVSALSTSIRKANLDEVFIKIAK